MKVRNQLLVASIAITAISISTVGAIVGAISLSSGSQSLEEQAKNQLVAIRENKKSQIEDYFQTIKNQLLTFSNDRMIVDATHVFTGAFRMFPDEIDNQVSQFRSSVKDYYVNEFAGVYRNSNGGASVDTARLLNQLDDESLALQYHYISSNPNPLGEKHKLDYSDDGTTYSAAHRMYHPPIRDFLEKFRFYDIFIADPETGDIVYSVFKELDYSTSLKDGPYANTGIGRAFKAANAANNHEFIKLDDFAPYLPSYDAQASFIASPIFDNGQKIGVLIFQMPLDTINNIMTYGEAWKKVGLGESGETYLVGEDFKARSMSRFLMEDSKGYLELMRGVGLSESVLNKIENQNSNIGLQEIRTDGSRNALAGNTNFEIFADYRDINVLSAYAPIDILGLNWAILSEIDEEEAFRPVAELRNKIITSAITVFVIMLVAVVIVAVWFSGRFVAPILVTVDGLRKVARGDLTDRYESKRNDELGAMIGDLGNLTSDLSDVVSQVTGSVTTIRDSISDVASGNANLSQRTQEQASSLEEIASSMEEMTSTVNQNADNATQANELASAARDQAEKSGSVVGGAVEAMNKINDSSNKIADIIGVIDEIAFQTNLLALNAAVEAARAGEQGRGFAVVASEVRNLAGRSATAAKEIKGLIEDSVAKVADGTKLVDQSGQVLEEIVGSVKKVSNIVAEIAAASKEQSTGIEQVNRALTQMDEMTQQNASLVEEAAAASEAVDAQAEELANQVAYFKVDLGGMSAGVSRNQQARTVSSPQAQQEQPAVAAQPKVALPQSKRKAGVDSNWEDF